MKSMALLTFFPICVNTIHANEYDVWAHPKVFVLGTTSSSLFITSSESDQLPGQAFFSLFIKSME